MNGSEIKEWRTRNDYRSQAMLQMELELGSRGTISEWEKLEKIPRLVELALIALEEIPELRKTSGKSKNGMVQHNQRKKDRSLPKL